jgi:uncharacterized membrane protein
MAKLNSQLLMLSYSSLITAFLLFPAVQGFAHIGKAHPMHDAIVMYLLHLGWLSLLVIASWSAVKVFARGKGIQQRWLALPALTLSVGGLLFVVFDLVAGIING